MAELPRTHRHRRFAQSRWPVRPVTSVPPLMPAIMRPVSVLSADNSTTVQSVRRNVTAPVIHAPPVVARAAPAPGQNGIEVPPSMPDDPRVARRGRVQSDGLVITAQTVCGPHQICRDGRRQAHDPSHCASGRRRAGHKNAGGSATRTGPAAGGASCGDDAVSTQLPAQPSGSASQPTPARNSALSPGELRPPAEPPEVADPGSRESAAHAHHSRSPQPAAFATTDMAVPTPIAGAQSPDDFVTVRPLAAAELVAMPPNIVRTEQASQNIEPEPPASQPVRPAAAGPEVAVPGMQRLLSLPPMSAPRAGTESRITIGRVEVQVTNIPSQIPAMPEYPPVNAAAPASAVLPRSYYLDRFFFARDAT